RYTGTNLECPFQNSIAHCPSVGLETYRAGTEPCRAGPATRRVLVGRPDEALEAFLNSENVKSGESPLRARFLLFCGEAWLRTDRQPEALDLARRGPAEACDRGERGHEAYALRLLGNILDANGDVTSAEEHYHRALVLG